MQLSVKRDSIKINMADIKEIRKILSPSKQPDKQFYLDLLDEDKQRLYEEGHLNAVLLMLKAIYVKKLLDRIKDCAKARDELMSSPDYTADKYRQVLELNAQIAGYRRQVDSYKCFFTETYFARMDLYDDKEGYNSYYIGKKGSTIRRAASASPSTSSTINLYCAGL